MSDADLIEQLRAKVMSLRSPRGASRGHRDATDSSWSTTSKDSGSKLHSGQALCLSRMATHEADAAIVVNVGGVNYTTTVATLKAVESSYFSLMLNGLWEPARTQGGDIFVDRNGELFGYVLEHLRGQCHKEPDTFQLPEDLDTLKALLREAEFYRLPALVSRLNKRKEEMMDVKDRSDTEPDTSDAIDLVPRVDLDIAYSAVSSAHCQFTEEAIHDLTMRVNYQILQKGHEGFRVRDVNSRVHLNPNDPMMPYSMTCTAVLVRERKPQQAAGCAKAPTAQGARRVSPIPLVLHHQQPQVAVGRLPSPAHSPRCEIGRYRMEASALVASSEDRLWHHQGAVSPTPEPVADPLQQVTEARLRLQALVAEHASKEGPPAIDGSSDGRRSKSLQSGSGILDHSLNPPVGGMDALAIRCPPALLSREHSAAHDSPSLCGPAVDELGLGPSTAYSGEVRRIMGIPQAPGCQSNPPRLIDPTEVQGPLELLHSGSRSSDRDRRLPGSDCAPEVEVQETSEQGNLGVPDTPDRQTGCQSHDQDASSCEDESVSCSESSEDGGEQETPEEIAVEDAAVQMENAEPSVMAELPCTGNRTSDTSCHEQSAALVNPNSDIDGPQEDTLQAPPLGMSAGTIATTPDELPMDDHANTHESDINNECTEADSGATTDGQHSAAASVGSGDGMTSSSRMEHGVVPCIDAGDEKSACAEMLPIGGTEVVDCIVQAGVPGEAADIEDQGHGARDAEGVEQPEVLESASEPIRQPPTPDREARKRQAHPRCLNAHAALHSATNSKMPVAEDGDGDECLGTQTAKEAVDFDGNPSDAGEQGGVSLPSGSTVPDVTDVGVVPNASPAPTTLASMSKAKKPGVPSMLLPPAKYSRYHAPRQEDGKVTEQPGSGSRSGPLVVGAHKSNTSQPLLQKGKVASNGKARSRIPHLNLAPITSATGREGRQLMGRRPASEFQEDRSQGSTSGTVPKFSGSHPRRSGLVRPGTGPTGLARQPSSTTSQRPGGRGRRLTGLSGAGQR